MASITQLSLLQELLTPSEDLDKNVDSVSNNFQTPGNIGTSRCLDKKQRLQEKNSKDIWGNEEVPDCELPLDVLDDRITPEYETLFKQKVSSEDIFLGMSDKNPSTACCEDFVTKVYLPETKYADMTLNITDTFMDCQTPKFKLGLHFPHRVESKNGKAQWNSDQCLLTITVPLRREYDFLNQTST